MEDLEIREPEDWYAVQNRIRKMCRRFPEFTFDYNRLCKNIEVKIRDLCVIDIELRKNNNSIYFQQVRKNKLIEINDTIKMFSKILLVATLAKR
jgi:hypothetical protein